MKRFLLPLFYSVLLLISTSAIAAPTNRFVAPDCVKDLSSLPIFIIKSYYGNNNPSRGTAFLVSKNFWITSAHVVDDNPANILIKINENVTIKLEILYLNEEKDVAVLHGPSPDLIPMKLMSSVLTPKETIWNIGFPGMAGDYIVSYEGASFKVGEKTGFLLTGALALPGMSGGPTVRCNNGQLEVVGAVQAFTLSKVQETTTITADGKIERVRIVMNSGGSSVSTRIDKHLITGMDIRLKQLDEMEAANK